MIFFSNFINFFTIAIAVGLTSLGVAIGNSLAAIATIKALDKQPGARNEILKTSIIGMALTETSVLLGFIISILLLTTKSSSITSQFYWELSNIGIACAICISGFTVGLVSSYAVKDACFAVSRQPFVTNKIINIMLLTLSFIQTSIIFGFVIALLIYYQASQAITLMDSLRHIGSGICIGLGCIGPAIGLAHFAKSACMAIGTNTKSYDKIISYTFISEALIETPIVFSLIISLLIITSPTNNLLLSITMLLAGICTGISNIMPGISSGKTAASGCAVIANKPGSNISILNTSMLAQVFIDSSTIFGFIISLLLIFLVK